MRLVFWTAIAAATVGVFSTWITAGPVSLDGTQGPNNGWLVLIVAAFALGWRRSLARGSWIGVVGVLGCAVVMGWTAVENWVDSRNVLEATASYGLLSIVGASVALGGVALLHAVETARTRDLGVARARRST